MYTTTTLHKHQEEAVKQAMRALKRYNGVLIADEMGLGKTLIAIHCFLKKAMKKIQKQKTSNVLIVAPSAVLIEWQCQLEKHINYEVFPPDVLQIVSYGVRGKSVLTAEKRKQRLNDWFDNKVVSYIVLASYGTVRNDAAYVLQKKWHYVVMDECHQLKNDKGQSHQMFKAFLRNRTKRIGISGTPNANHPVQDLCALAQLLFPTLPELSDRDNYKTSKPSILKELIIRRTLKDVGMKLPDLHLQQVYLSFEPQSNEWNAYKDQQDKTLRALDRYIQTRRYANQNQIIALQIYQKELNMLGKINTHYQISDVRHKTIALEDVAISTKQKYVQNEIDTYAISKNEKLIVTSASSTFLSILHMKNNVLHPNVTICFTGDTPQAQRVDVLRQWRSSSGPNVLLLSMKAGGVGLTLIEACRLVCVDGLSQSNPADRDQVIKRVHRFGQTRPVTIVDLCVRGSIDEVMKEAVHPSKRRIANHLLRSIPVLTSTLEDPYVRKHKTTSNALCAVGSALYPMWKKMITERNISQPSIEHNTLHTNVNMRKVKRNYEKKDLSNRNYRKRKAPHEPTKTLLPKIKKKKRRKEKYN